jgi:hypothetical protein
MNQIPIGDARKIAEERRFPVVIVLGYCPESGNYFLTSYGQTKRLCRLGHLILEGIDGSMEGIVEDAEDTFFAENGGTP